MIQPLNPKSNGKCLVVALPMQSSDGALTHVSASSIKLYLSCSLKYFFKKIAKLEEPTSPAFQLGKAVHAGIQAFHLGRWRGEAHDEQTVLEAYNKAFVDQEAADLVNYKTGERDKLLEKGETILKAYLDSDHAKMEDIPLGVEVKLEEEFPQLPSPLLGYIDLVRPGNIAVDFKTCAATPNVELEAFQHELQLTAYQLLIEEATGEPVEARELVFLVKTAKPKIIAHRIPPATEHDKARFWAIAQAAIDGIYHERFYPQPGMACSWCSFRKECTAWRGGSL